MSGFKLLTFLQEERPVAGVLVRDRIYPAEALLGGTSVRDKTTTLGILNEWDLALPALTAAASAPETLEGGIPANAAQLSAPIPNPGAYFCVAANYYKHSAEITPDRKATREQREPYFFLKPGRHTTRGPGEAVQVPTVTQKLDWELELAVVIGREARNLTVENAMSCVAGYTIVNDLSARDLARRDDWVFVSDWFGQKVFDGSMPMGPWIVPASDITDLGDVPLKLWLNDEIQQDSTTADMIFSIPEQIEYITRRVTLYPGDVIATGSPAGVGAPRGLFLKPGDRLRCEIAGIGSMETPII